MEDARIRPRKAVLFSFLAILILLPFFTIGSGTFPHVETGTVTISIPVGATTATSTVTFGRAFASTVYAPSAEPTGVPVGPEKPVLSATLLSIETPGQSWVGFPSASTELFGDALGEHRVIVTGIGSVKHGFFSVLCTVGSTSSTALLRPEWSNDGSVWNELAQTSGQLDAAVDAASCGTGIPSTQGLFQNIDPNAIAANTIYLRVVGMNGNDFLDTVELTQVDIEFGIQPNTFQCGISSRAAASMNIRVTVDYIVTNTPQSLSCLWGAIA